MIITDYKGYIEGTDITKIPVQYLAYPSKNVLVHKGKISTRGGLVNDGVAADVTEAVHSEYVWQSALSGTIPIRVHGQTVQVKYNSKWYTIFTALDSNVTRVFFATWVDANGSIIKNRLFFVDGSATLYMWTGFIADVASYAANVITISGTDTLGQLGLDAGNVTTQTILHYAGTATTGTEYTYSNDPTAGQDITLDTTPSPVPVADDVVIAKPIAYANTISSAFPLDFIYSYKNHAIVGNYGSVNLYWSHIVTFVLATGLDFTMPAVANRTAATAIFMQLDGNVTALTSRKNVLWVSDAHSWYKIVKTETQNAYDLWVDVEKREFGELKGALPMATAKFADDIIFVAQDKTVQRLTEIDVIGKDEIQNISDSVEDLFTRLDLSDIRVYYLTRAIYFVLPIESTLIMLDIIEEYFQPPQTIPINCISVIDGIKYGHHNAENQTYKLFSGRNDLGSPYEAVIAFGYTNGDHNFRYKKHTTFGVSCRLTANTKVLVEQFFEENGAKSTSQFTIDGSLVKTYAIDDDVSWATHPYAERSWGGADMVAEELRRAIVFSKFTAIHWFDFRPIFTMSGSEQEFHLLAHYFDAVASERGIGNDLFVSK